MSMINNKNLKLLCKVIDAGFTDEKAIASISAEDMTGFCKNIAEITAVIALQKAVKNNCIISFLTEKG